MHLPQTAASFPTHRNFLQTALISFVAHGGKLSAIIE
jgi:hypothetical protein